MLPAQALYNLHSEAQEAGKNGMNAFLKGLQGMPDNEFDYLSNLHNITAVTALEETMLIDDLLPIVIAIRDNEDASGAIATFIAVSARPGRVCCLALCCAGTAVHVCAHLLYVIPTHAMLMPTHAKH